MSTPLTLRGHHFLCGINYSGSGYTEDFVTNFDTLCTRLTAGEPITLTWWPDTICRPMLGHPACHCHRWTIPLRDLWGFLTASFALRKLCFPPRTLVLTAADVKKLRRNFRRASPRILPLPKGLARIGCTGCEWFSHCSATSHAGNPRSKLHPVTKITP